MRRPTCLVYTWPQTFGRSGDSILVMTEEGRIFMKWFSRNPIQSPIVPWQFAHASLDGKGIFRLDVSRLLKEDWKEHAVPYRS